MKIFGSKVKITKKIFQEIKNIKNIQENIKNIDLNLEEYIFFLTLFKEELETEKITYDEVTENIKELDKRINIDFNEIEKLKIQKIYSQENFNLNAIVTIHAGAGGTESMDWADMMYRMYLKWAEKNDFDVEEINKLDGDEAGIKNVTFIVKGLNAFGNLVSENGVHRLVRHSPFDSGNRRHTSFASVEVIPEIEFTEEKEIKNEELKIDTFRASGAGGQHVNKTESAIRITHLPTNIIVTCQSERSQIQNKETAMKMLKSKLKFLEEKKQKEELNKLKGIKSNIDFGSQIRSYVLEPYTLVKDNRTGYEDGNAKSVLDGNLNEFIYSYLLFLLKENN